MKRASFFAAGLLLAGTLVTPLPDRAAEPGKITVFAAASLRESFDAAVSD